MVKGSGKLNIDAVTLGEATMNLLGTSKVLVGKFALVNSATGDRYGAATLDSWGTETLQKFQELIELMEIDLAAQIFTSGEATHSGDATVPVLEDAVPGL